MKPKQIFWGLLFLVFGLLVLINNFSTLDFGWPTIWKFWPAVFIFWGISLMLKNELFKNLLAAFAAIVLAVTLFATFKSAFGAFDSFLRFEGNGIKITVDGESTTNFFSESYDTTTSNAVLNFKAGAGNFKINGTTDNLFSAFTETHKDNNYELNRLTEDDKVILDFSMEKARFNIMNGKVKNKAEIKLNPAPVWNLKFDVGAASTLLDLRPFKVKNLDVNIGAASLKIYLGDLYNDSRVNISAGASSIDLEVPESVGCVIKIDAALSSKKFPGFEKRDESYYSPNFDEAEKKIIIQIDSGVSSIKVKRTSQNW